MWLRPLDAAVFMSPFSSSRCRWCGGGRNGGRCIGGCAGGGFTRADRDGRLADQPAGTFAFGHISHRLVERTVGTVFRQVRLHGAHHRQGRVVQLLVHVVPLLGGTGILRLQVVDAALLRIHGGHHLRVLLQRQPRKGIVLGKIGPCRHYSIRFVFDLFIFICHIFCLSLFLFFAFCYIYHVL